MKESTNRQELLVFYVTRDTECSECGRELWHGNLITLEKDKALCLSCADLDHLEFLPAGNAALTRRSKKHARLYAIVLEWSRRRKRYERQGILAEPAAIEKAEQECLADEEVRAARRERAAQRRAELDQEYIKAFAQKIKELYPNCPPGEETKIAEHACRKYSGRVGRSAAAKQLDAKAVRLAVIAHIRHAHTRYDDLLLTGCDRWEARELVSEEIDEVLKKWGNCERVLRRNLFVEVLGKTEKLRTEKFGGRIQMEQDHDPKQAK